MILCVFFVIFFLGAGIYVGMIIHWFNHMEMGPVFSKSHVELSVSEKDMIDYHSFLHPGEDKTEILRSIKKRKRIKIARYMKRNNLKLKKGIYCIPEEGWIDGKEVIVSYDEYVKCFDFEKIKR